MQIAIDMTMNEWIVSEKMTRNYPKQQTMTNGFTFSDGADSNRGKLF